MHEGRIIGEGFHARYGGPHAEVACLNAVAAADRHLIPDSTLYVSLEPCAHYGKTPPCALRIIQEGIREVVVINRDPFPEVAGKGFDLLQDAGVNVVHGLLEAEGRWVNRRFFTYFEQRRPYIVLKWAQSADGLMAPADRRRTPLSGPMAQRLVHRWRTEEQAILVGYRTALHDNPQLNARFWQGPQPLRLVEDRDLALPLPLHLYDGSQPTWIFNNVREGSEDALRYVFMAPGTSLPEAIIQQLYDGGVRSLLIEGGAATLMQFIEAGLWDEARILKSPVSLGQGVPAPLLTDSTEAAAYDLGTDRLHLHLAATSGFAFIPERAF
jgi:diaminohydroxyphosphoribosylaminopyrimidine deaminase/5-amino-6-(5-phosphoribosylamino)uracil reductase